MLALSRSSKLRPSEYGLDSVLSNTSKEGRGSAWEVIGGLSMRSLPVTRHAADVLLSVGYYERFASETLDATKGLEAGLASPLAAFGNLVAIPKLRTRTTWDSQGRESWTVLLGVGLGYQAN
jgi:hypothetical protein